MKTYHEDPEARAKWIVLKVAHSTYSFTYVEMNLIHRTAKKLGTRKNHTFPIDLTLEERNKLEKICSLAHINRPLAPTDTRRDF